jgi:hypothetical protein
MQCDMQAVAYSKWKQVHRSVQEHASKAYSTAYQHADALLTDVHLRLPETQAYNLACELELVCTTSAVYNITVAQAAS